VFERCEKQKVYEKHRCCCLEKAIFFFFFFFFFLKADSNGTIYVTIPRWKEGTKIPSSLFTVDSSGILHPFPSASANLFSSGWITYVQSMEIDSRDWMWILDVGRINLMDKNNPIINLQPRLIIYDLKQNCVVRWHNFPQDVFPANNSFANDIVVDEERGLAYMSDTWADGGIVVYDYFQDKSHRFDHPTFHGDKNGQVTINNVTYGVSAPTDGIALSPDKKWVYYCSLSNELLWKLPVSVLSNFSATNDDLDPEFFGSKGFSDGMAFDALGNMYYGSQQMNALQQLNVSTNHVGFAQSLVRDPETVQWVDTLAFFKPRRSLLFTSNALMRFFANTLSDTDVNFRIIEVPINADSYVLSNNPKPKSAVCIPPPPSSYLKR
jgi:sugar lactone lactonase YvrE